MTPPCWHRRDPMWWAACQGHVPLARALLESGYDVNRTRVMLWDSLRCRMAGGGKDTDRGGG